MPDSGNLPLARVVVLGANGFIGGHVMSGLAREPAFQPVGLIRRQRGPTKTEVVLCDATKLSDMRRALTGAAYAVNCIAGNEATMLAATRRLCDVARRSGMQRIIHLSSMAVYGAAAGLVGEHTPAVSPVSRYGAAKQACEQVVREFVADGGDAVILRPGCVYGPGSEQWTGRMGRLLQAGRLGDLGADGDGICNLTFVNDLVSATILALRLSEVAGQVFNIAMADPPSWNEYLIRFAHALGATPIRRLSAGQLKFETKLNAPILRLVGMVARASRVSVRVPDAITPSLASLFRQEIRLNVHKATNVLFQETSLEWALAASARWTLEQQPRASEPSQSTFLEAQRK